MPEELVEAFGLMEAEDFPPRYNIAPTQPIIVVTATEPANEGSNRPDRRAMLVRWGLLPRWVKDVKAFPLLFNARADSAAEKAAFRAAMRHRRVLVPASGFFEWRKGSGRKACAQPFWIRPREGRLIAMAGERMKVDGFTELSGVCTHPDFRGQGLAGALSRLRGVQALTLGVETLEHGQALGHALDEVGLGDGRFGHGRYLFVVPGIAR